MKIERKMSIPRELDISFKGRMINKMKSDHMFEFVINNIDISEYITNMNLVEKIVREVVFAAKYALDSAFDHKITDEILNKVIKNTFSILCICRDSVQEIDKDAFLVAYRSDGGLS